MLQTVIFIGRSGAGKGVQSGLLQELLKKENPETPILYIETGAHFRKHVKSAGYTWERVRTVTDKGERAPDFVAIWIWSGVFVDQMHGNEHLVFDGMPRSVDEAKLLDTALSFYERKDPVVVFLNVSQGWAEERLRGRGRADDLNPEVVARRLAFFEKDVAPAVEHYRTSPSYRFLDINGEQTPEEVHADIVKQLTIN